MLEKNITFEMDTRLLRRLTIAKWILTVLGVFWIILTIIMFFMKMTYKPVPPVNLKIIDMRLT